MAQGLRVAQGDGWACFRAAWTIVEKDTVQVQDWCQDEKELDVRETTGR